jgi:WD40 repeat protein
MSPDGRLLASAGSHDTLTLWSLDDGCELKFFSRVMESDTVRALAISADGRLLASGGDDRAIRLWSLSEGTHKACLMDLAANRPTTKGVQYRSRGDGGQMASYTLPCGSPIPAGAVCTCNCVPGSACSCVGHSNRSCSCVPVHYWHPN